MLLCNFIYIYLLKGNVQVPINLFSGPQPSALELGGTISVGRTICGKYAANIQSVNHVVKVQHSIRKISAQLQIRKYK